MINPCAATANATASAFGTSLTMRIAAPAPACVAAPTGAIGSAADAADAQRNARASGNDAPTASACNRTKTASARSAQETLISIQACQALRRQAQWSCSQRPSLNRATQPTRERRGKKKTSRAAASPAAATSANPICTLARSDAAAATEAAGVSAAEARDPTTVSGRQGA